MVVGLGGVASEEYVADVVDGEGVDTIVAQQRIGVPAGGSPEGIEANSQAGFFDGGKFTISFKRARYMARGSSGWDGWRSFSASQRIDLYRRLRFLLRFFLSLRATPGLHLVWKI